MVCGPSERLDGVLNAGQLYANDGQPTLSTVGRLTTDLGQVCDLRGSRLGEGGGGGGGGLGEDRGHCKWGDWDYGEEREGQRDRRLYTQAPFARREDQVGTCARSATSQSRQAPTPKTQRPS